MNPINIEVCPYCGGNNIGIGYQLGAGRVFPDVYAYHSASSGSDLEILLCKDCGSLLHSRVIKPELFHQHSPAWRESLGEYLNQNGILLCNENPELPSLCGLGYCMENIISLIELRRAFYCKAYKKRSTYLSVRAYQLLRRCRADKPLSPEAEEIYGAMKGVELVEKEELRKSLGMEKKVFDRAFDLLLENLYVTARGGKRLNHNWYAYLYCTDEVWRSRVDGLHFSGDPNKALWKLVGKHMKEDDFADFVK